jgi:hypothetical protein
MVGAGLRRAKDEGKQLGRAVERMMRPFNLASGELRKQARTVGFGGKASKMT